MPTWSVFAGRKKKCRCCWMSHTKLVIFGTHIFSTMRYNGKALLYDVVRAIISIENPEAGSNFPAYLPNYGNTSIILVSDRKKFTIIHILSPTHTRIFFVRMILVPRSRVHCCDV